MGKAIVYAIRVYEEDKKEFQKICNNFRIESNGKITEAMVFREMLDWLKKNKEVIKGKFLHHRVRG